MTSGLHAHIHAHWHTHTHTLGNDGQTHSLHFPLRLNVVLTRRVKYAIIYLKEEVCSQGTSKMPTGDQWIEPVVLMGSNKSPT